MHTEVNFELKVKLLLVVVHVLDTEAVLKQTTPFRQFPVVTEI